MLAAIDKVLAGKLLASNLLFILSLEGIRNPAYKPGELDLEDVTYLDPTARKHLKAYSPIGRSLGTILLMSQKWAILLQAVLGVVECLDDMGPWFVSLAQAGLSQQAWDTVVLNVFTDLERAAVDAPYGAALRQPESCVQDLRP